MNDRSESIRKHIRNALIVAIISIGATAIAAGLALGGTEIVPGITAWMLFDAALISGLAYGVYKRSRVCAVLLTGYGIINQFITLSDGIAGSVASVGWIPVYFYFRGALATFDHHRLLVTGATSTTSKSSALPPALPLAFPRSGPPPERLYRITRNGRFLGEYGITAIKEMLRAGSLVAEDCYFNAYAKDWHPLHTHPEIA